MMKTNYWKLSFIVVGFTGILEFQNPYTKVCFKHHRKVLIFETKSWINTATNE